MLQQIRSYAKGFLAVILFGLLILSFGLWGIGDMFRGGGGDTAIARAGKAEISLEAFSTELRREIRRLAPLFGGQLDMEKARQFGLFDRVLDAMVNRAAFDAGIAEEGLAASAALVARVIREDPTLHDPSGQFDRRLFEAQLANNQITEAQFMAILRERLLRDQLAGALASGGGAPETILAPLFAYRQERRVAEILAIPRAAFPAPEPGEADLAAFYKERERAFMAPSYRALTAVAFGVDDIAKGTSVAEEKVREEYEARKAEFETRETRAVEQFILAGKDAAERALADIRKGKDFAAAAKAATGQAPLALGEVERQTLEAQAPALAEAVFAATAPGTVGPVETPFGWHVLKLAKITPARTRPFAEVRGDLARALAREAATDALDKTADKLEDSLAGGASLADAAKGLGLAAIAVAAVDAAGRDPKGEPVKSLTAEMVLAAFATEPGRDSRLTRAGDETYFVLRVESATPAQPRPLESVRAAVVAAWKDDRREQAAKARAQALVERAKAGADLAGLASGEREFKVFLPAPFTRAGADAQHALTAQLAALLFESKQGEAVMGATAEGYAVARLKQIVPADAKTDAAALEQMREQLKAETGNDLISAYAGWIKSRLTIETNRALFDRIAN